MGSASALKGPVGLAEVATRGGKYPVYLLRGNRDNIFHWHTLHPAPTSDDQPTAHFLSMATPLSITGLDTIH